MAFSYRIRCLTEKPDRDQVKAPVQIKGILAQYGNKYYTKWVRLC